MTTPLKVATRVSHDAALIPVIGDLLYSNRAMLGAAIDVALGSGIQDIEIDLTNCHRIDSAGMGALVSASKKAREHGSRIRLVGLQEDLHETLRQTRLDTLFDWPESPADSPESGR